MDNTRLAVGEEEVEVLERLPEEEGFHHVARPRVQRVPHVPDRGVTPGHLGVLLNTLVSKIHFHHGQGEFN